jgi:hypothetical protein
MNRRTALLAAAFALAGVSTDAFAQAQQDFAIVNRTGYQIDEIYVGPSSSPNWGRDLLGQNVLRNGQTFNIRFPQNTRECLFDIKVVYNDRDQSEFRQVNLCRISRVNLFWDRARRTTRATTE